MAPRRTPRVRPSHQAGRPAGKRPRVLYFLARGFQVLILKNVRVAVVTVSDSVSAGKSQDRSGPALSKRCEELGWKVVSARLSADDEPGLRTLISELADSGGVDLVLTSGGTGIGPRDVTPEATAAIVRKVLPGISERMRFEGQKSNPRAALSRGIAGVRGSALIINLPGSPRGAVESLDAVSSLLPHAVAVLGGARHD